MIATEFTRPQQAWAAIMERREGARWTAFWPFGLEAPRAQRAARRRGGHAGSGVGMSTGRSDRRACGGSSRRRAYVRRATNHLASALASCRWGGEGGRPMAGRCGCAQSLWFGGGETIHGQFARCICVGDGARGGMRTSASTDGELPGPPYGERGGEERFLLGGRAPGYVPVHEDLRLKEAWFAGLEPDFWEGDDMVGRVRLIPAARSRREGGAGARWGSRVEGLQRGKGGSGLVPGGCGTFGFLNPRWQRRHWWGRWAPGRTRVLTISGMRACLVETWGVSIIRMGLHTLHGRAMAVATGRDGGLGHPPSAQRLWGQPAGRRRGRIGRGKTTFPSP